MAYIIGTPTIGHTTFQTADPYDAIEMVPGMGYSITAELGDISYLPVGWEDDLYRRIKEEIESHPGCKVTGFKIGYDTGTMVVTWSYNPDPSPPQAAFALTTTAIILGVLGVAGIGIVGYNFLQLREFYEEGSEFVTIAVGGLLVIGVLVAAGFLIGKLKG
jgi:hypothetical protein